MCQASRPPQKVTSAASSHECGSGQHDRQDQRDGDEDRAPGHVDDRDPADPLADGGGDPHDDEGRQEGDQRLGHHERTARERVRSAGADGEDLVDAHPAVAEGEGAADEVEPPHADDLLADQLAQPREVGLEAVDPARDGQHVVLAQRVHVADLEAARLDEADGLADRPHVHVGGDERLDERAAAGVLAAARALARHLLDQHPAARLDRAAQHLDVRRVVAGADVLAHLEGADGVEVVALGDLAVVLEPDLDPVLQAALGDPGVDELLLLRGDRHAGDLGAEVLARRAARASPSRSRRRASACPR